mmetsp:Transcript_81862/g.171238  ORF Transcript_81862/g.171238 Transcript_81862/m.171238 type:complete len:311 (-) Transcript_81862:914-1846(-)
MRQLHTSLQSLHVDGHQSQGRAGGGHPCCGELAALVVGFGRHEALGVNEELRLAVAETGVGLLPGAWTESQPRGTHNSMPSHELLGHGRLRPKEVGVGLTEHTDEWHLSRRVQHYLQEGQLSVAVLRGLLEGVVSVLQLRPEDLDTGAVLLAHVGELHLCLFSNLLHFVVVRDVLDVQEEIDAALDAFHDETAALVLARLAGGDHGAGLSEEVESGRAGAVVLKRVGEEVPEPAILFQQQPWLSCCCSSVCLLLRLHRSDSLASISALEPSLHLSHASCITCLGRVLGGHLCLDSLRRIFGLHSLGSSLG